LNIYDLLPANNALGAVGFGLHHSGTKIHGMEYPFASGGGIFENTPKQAAGAQFCVTVELGAYDGGQAELRQALSGEFEKSEKLVSHTKNCVSLLLTFLSTVSRSPQ
jgi:hypothetical protein